MKWFWELEFCIRFACWLRHLKIRVIVLLGDNQYTLLVSLQKRNHDSSGNKDMMRGENGMNFYHMSQTLQLGNQLIVDYQKNMELVQPFVQALEQGRECFYGMVLNGKYLYAMLGKFGLGEWSDYAKWATEGAFEFVRKTEFLNSYSRMRSFFFYDNISACKKLYDYDWGCECEEEQQKVHLFEVELDDTVPQRRDMNIYDEAYEAMTKNQDVEFVFTCARRYFEGEHTQEPVWEILSDKNAKTVADISYILR